MWRCRRQGSPHTEDKMFWQLDLHCQTLALLANRQLFGHLTDTLPHYQLNSQISSEICNMQLRQISLLSAVMPAMALAGGDTYFTGDGTSYTLGQVSAGNCNFMYDPGVGDNYAALNNEQWDSTHNCGRCAEVSCDDARCSDTTSTQVVYIVDRCPECKQGDLDLSPTVFKTLTGSDPSRYTIKWKFVDCPVSGNIEYCTKSGSSSSWLAIQPANFANGVASMKIANQDVTMVDSCYYYLLNGGSNVDMSAVSVELTSFSGETVTETLSLTADNCTEGTSNFGASTTQQSSTQQSSTSQTAPAPTTAPTVAPTTAPPTTPAPVPTTAAPTATTATPTSYSSSSSSQTQTQQTSYTFTSSSASQSQTQQSEVSNYFNRLTNSSSSTTYKAGKVTAADESGSDVSILQSSEAGVEKTSSVQQQDDETDDTKQASTKSAAKSSGTSPVVVALIVLAVVGGIALAAVAYVVKKKKLDDKRIDRDEAMIRSFDTFSSPVEINATNIAKI
ncbi:hypothetical protein L917_20229 [Phytophthora nicotianae]|uniref:Expansin-like EG45 domain-containing protein n=3 Tax=Phytophthora nicotianae TaxID=4792 RepID=V9DYP0_PHYNI|nr:hypothetical protein F443_21093 [Phytophthora nicotianae P1569]ETL79068.1 hypothetical protein L917_20229 [Phytophthora nicotianae]ETM32333.1 hypothetical protein L914_20255 [Phytophthora nicotianae]